MDYITAISFFIGIVGMAASAYGAYLTIKSNREMKESKTIDWGQFQLASRSIGKSFLQMSVISPGARPCVHFTDGSCI